MVDRKLPGAASRPPFLKKVLSVQASGDEDLLGGKPAMIRSPILWFTLLFIPVLMGLYAGFNRPSRTPGVEAPRVIIYMPEDFVVTPLPSGQQSAWSAGRTVPVSCDFKEWVGRQADERMQAELKARKHAFRILPPKAPTSMYYSEDRVNFNVNANGKITRVWCG